MSDDPPKKRKKRRKRPVAAPDDDAKHTGAARAARGRAPEGDVDLPTRARELSARRMVVGAGAIAAIGLAIVAVAPRSDAPQAAARNGKADQAAAEQAPSTLHTAGIALVLSGIIGLIVTLHRLGRLGPDERLLEGDRL